MYVRRASTLGDFSSFLTSAENFAGRIANAGQQVTGFATRAQAAIGGGRSAAQEPDAASYGAVGAARVVHAARQNPALFIAGGAAVALLGVALLRHRR